MVDFTWPPIEGASFVIAVASRAEMEALFQYLDPSRTEKILVLCDNSFAGSTSPTREGVTIANLDARPKGARLCDTIATAFAQSRPDILLKLFSDGESSPARAKGIMDSLRELPDLYGSRTYIVTYESHFQEFADMSSSFGLKRSPATQAARSNLA